MKKTLCTLSLLVMLLLSACASVFAPSQTVVGSGRVASESRPAKDFSAIELAGSADVTVTLGETESVVVEAEDNLLPLIETTVQGGRLVIGTKPNTSISPTKPIRATVTLKALKAATLSGSGTLQIARLQASAVDFNLTGSGTITGAGAVDTLHVMLSGSGAVVGDALQAKSATVNLTGSGQASVYASEALVAIVSGSGLIQYRGHPARLEKTVTGSGQVSALP